MNAEPKFMLDSDTCIFLLRQTTPSVTERFREMLPGDAVISTITFGELFCGALKSQRAAMLRRELDELITLIPVVPLPIKCGELYGGIRSDLEKRGLRIGNSDMWIAAHALSLNLTLITNNTREFERIPRLKLENWV